jgi:hypothetical protein
MIMDTHEKKTTSKRGRPPKAPRNLIFYRKGRRIKGFDPEWGVDVNISEKDIRVGTKIYKSLGYDWTRWASKQSESGFYNAARTTPFLEPDKQADAAKLAQLEVDYRDCPQLRKVMHACAQLFNGERPRKPILLHGGFWLRVIAPMFNHDAGVDGLGRYNDERPYGKVWCSVITLPTNGSGVNYTLEPWYKTVNMSFPPIFCIRIDSDDDTHHGLKISPDWNPEELSNAILQSLWASKGIDSCQADVSIAETTPSLPQVASDDPSTSLLPSDEAPMLSGDPDGLPVQEDEKVDHIVDANKMIEPAPHPIPTTATIEPYRIYVPEEDVQPIEPTVMTEAERQLHAPIIPEATPSNVTRTWGEIKQTPIWMKGLTTSRDLQAPALLSRILETIISHEATARLTAECRAIADKKARNEFKADNMHVFYPSAVFAGRAGGSKKENVIGYTGIAVLDFDGLKTQADAEDMRDTIFMEFPEILFCAVSASGLGVYALVMLDFDGTEAGYKAALSAAMETFESKGYMPDTGCSDPTRARYMSSDPDALSRPDIYVPKAFAGGTEGAYILPASMLRGTWTNSGRKKKGAGRLYLEEALKRIETAPEGMKDTTLTSVMGSVARLIRNYDMNSEQVYAKVCKVADECGYDSRKTRDKVRRLGVKQEGPSL